jgi:hypothetical protein
MDFTTPVCSVSSSPDCHAVSESDNLERYATHTDVEEAQIWENQNNGQSSSTRSLMVIINAALEQSFYIVFRIMIPEVY